MIATGDCGNETQQSRSIMQWGCNRYLINQNTDIQCSPTMISQFSPKYSKQTPHNLPVSMLEWGFCGQKSDLCSIFAMTVLYLISCYTGPYCKIYLYHASIPSVWYLSAEMPFLLSLLKTNFELQSPTYCVYQFCFILGRAVEGRQFCLVLRKTLHAICVSQILTKAVYWSICSVFEEKMCLKLVPIPQVIVHRYHCKAWRVRNVLGD